MTVAIQLQTLEAEQVWEGSHELSFGQIEPEVTLRQPRVLVEEIFGGVTVGARGGLSGGRIWGTLV